MILNEFMNERQLCFIFCHLEFGVIFIFTYIYLFVNVHTVHMEVRVISLLFHVGPEELTQIGGYDGEHFDPLSYPTSQVDGNFRELYVVSTPNSV